MKQRDYLVKIFDDMRFREIFAKIFANMLLFCVKGQDRSQCARQVVKICCFAKFFIIFAKSRRNKKNRVIFFVKNSRENENVKKWKIEVEKRIFVSTQVAGVPLQVTLYCYFVNRL